MDKYSEVIDSTIEKMLEGVHIACPVCLDGLIVDTVNHRIFCEKHGDFVIPNCPCGDDEKPRRGRKPKLQEAA